MIETNVFALSDFLAAGLLPRGARFFSVSSDKAVFPTNLMGATKRWMEREIVAKLGIIGTTARFANVAFSAGVFLKRFCVGLRQQATACGTNGRAPIFYGPPEAAHLCLLAALTEVTVRFSPQDYLLK
ncbi:MAG: polysaccharide biosynthesis protein [Hyphomonadaceae bacterium]